MQRLAPSFSVRRILRLDHADQQLTILRLQMLNYYGARNAVASHSVKWVAAYLKSNFINSLVLSILLQIA